MTDLIDEGGKCKREKSYFRFDYIFIKFLRLLNSYVCDERVRKGPKGPHFRCIRSTQLESRYKIILESEKAHDV